MSQIWQATPRDTLVLRDGKPMVEGAGVATSLPLPWPSTIAGLCRTQAGLDRQTGKFGLTPEHARKIAVQGPWLALLDKVGNTSVDDWLFPAPLDVLWHKADKGDNDPGPPTLRYRLKPNQIAAGEQTDLELKHKDLQPLQVGTALKGKAQAGPPLWSWAELAKWLQEPSDGTDAKGFGWQLPLHEPRTHVSIEARTQTAQDGALFSIDHIRPWVIKPGGDNKPQPVTVCFGCEYKHLEAGTVFLGGERRVTYLEPSKAQRPAKPALNILDGLVRVVLLTPGLFKAGFRPDDSHWPDATLVAAAVGRPQPLSGWDFEKKGPKASRYMVPAGSVYWLQFASNEDAAAWADKNWWTCISDEPQDRLDGFGLCVVGVG